MAILDRTQSETSLLMLIILCVRQLKISWLCNHYFINSQELLV